MGWLSDWAKRIELTIDNTNVDSDLADFPVLIYISAASGIGAVDASAVFDELISDANRKKIAVTTSDGTTQCYVEIERWDDANEKAWLWVKVPSVAAASSTALHLYYDSTKADNTSYVGDTTDAVTHNVWDSNFVGVWHMAQDPNGDGADAIKDSTSNQNDGTPYGTMTTADLVDGKIGKAIDFDGVNDYLAFSTISISGAWTAEVTADPSGDTQSGDGFVVFDGKGIVQAAGNWCALAGNDVQKKGNALSITGDFVNIVASFDGDSTYLMYEDGVENSADETNTGWKLGGVYRIASGYLNRKPQGRIDEVRISDTERSPAWIKATNYSIRDAIITWGEEEAGGSTYIEDASLDLSAYSRALENLQSYLRAHNGIELRDLTTTLEAFSLGTEDFSTLLIAALESTGDFAANFETWATQYKNLAGTFDVKGQAVESLMSFLETARAEYKSLAAFLSVTDGSILNDLCAFFSVTDGSTLKNLGLYLKAVQSVPAFRSITAQRVSSVVHEVS